MLAYCLLAYLLSQYIGLGIYLFWDLPQCHTDRFFSHEKYETSQTLHNFWQLALILYVLYRQWIWVSYKPDGAQTTDQSKGPHWQLRSLRRPQNRLGFSLSHAQCISEELLGQCRAPRIFFRLHIDSPPDLSPGTKNQFLAVRTCKAYKKAAAGNFDNFNKLKLKICVCIHKSPRSGFFPVLSFARPSSARRIILVQSWKSKKTNWFPYRPPSRSAWPPLKRFFRSEVPLETITKANIRESFALTMCDARVLPRSLHLTSGNPSSCHFLTLYQKNV